MTSKSPQLTRRQTLQLAAGALASVTGVSLHAQAYPSRAVKIVVPFGPGGPADLYARFIAQALQETLGQAFVVENKPGGGAVIGADAVAKSPADGHTLLLMSNTLTINETLMPGKPYSLAKDFTGVAPVNYSDLVLVTKPGLAARNVSELVQLAKAKPGSLSYASSGPGTPYHLAGELFKMMAGIDAVHVPYKNSGAARTDIIGGQVDFMFDALPGMVANIQGGKVKALATTGQVRSTIMPELPTVRESGLPEYEAVIWNGVMAPKSTPAAVVAKLNAEIRRLVTKPETEKTWLAQGIVPMTMDVEQFDRYVSADIAKWARVVKGADIKL